ncbi:hypothetical protein ACHQM5_014595 [Ranunculus cassubicifolius]
MRKKAKKKVRKVEKNIETEQNKAETKTDEERDVHYWLLKTEPGEWSWEDQAANGGISQWDGVKNKQAQNYMKSMKLGDLCFFYHSGSKSRCIVGVVSVSKEWYTDKEDGAIDVRAMGEMRQMVDLKEMKGEDELQGFTLFKQPRLSVVPVSKKIWDRICELGGGYGLEDECKDD